MKFRPLFKYICFWKKYIFLYYIIKWSFIRVCYYNQLIIEIAKSRGCIMFQEDGLKKWFPKTNEFRYAWTKFQSLPYFSQKLIFRMGNYDYRVASQSSYTLDCNAEIRLNRSLIFQLRFYGIALSAGLPLILRSMVYRYSNGWIWE